MSSRNVLESQQSVHAATAGRRAAGGWKLATGQALSLRPNRHGVLQIAQGQAWVTLRGALADLPGAAVDHVLQPGQQLLVAPGQHVVMEAWNPQGSAEAVAFRWDAPPLSQSERSGVYQDVLNRLRREGHVYPCFCTRAQLHATVAPNLGDTQFIYPGTCAHLTPEEAAERAKKFIADLETIAKDGDPGWKAADKRL